MSKYEKLWKYIQKSNKEQLVLSFEEIGEIAGVALDHSFLQYKKELPEYGWKVDKISMKAQTVRFIRILPIPSEVRNTEKYSMKNKALVVIDLQNDITKNYREIIAKVNEAIEIAVQKGLNVVYIRHNNLSDGTRTFKPNTRGSEFVSELKIVSDYVFTKTKSNALTSEEFVNFIKKHDLTEFYIVGADAAACIKSTCFNMAKSGYIVHVLSDCITSYDKKKLPEWLAYYESKGCHVAPLGESKDSI